MKFKTDKAVNNNSIKVASTRPVFKPKNHLCAQVVHTSVCGVVTAMLLSVSPVAFSQSTFGTAVDPLELDGNDGFIVNGFDTAEYLRRSGNSVSSAGDVNGDGVADLIIGTEGTEDPDFGSPSISESYVVFGGSGVGSIGTIELSELNGSDGFSINGVRIGGFVRTSVSKAGDINGDGLADLIVG